MKLSVEELMKPRYEVIADWPCMRDMHVGKVIEMNGRWPNPGSTIYWKWSITDCQGTRDYTTLYFERWPHLFKPLQWYSKRKPEEMPDYLRCIRSDSIGHYQINEGVIYKLLELDWYKDINEDGYFHRWRITVETTKGRENRFSISDFLPATESEYSSYKQSIKS